MTIPLMFTDVQHPIKGTSKKNLFISTVCFCKDLKLLLILNLWTNSLEQKDKPRADHSSYRRSDQSSHFLSLDGYLLHISPKLSMVRYSDVKNFAVKIVYSDI